MIHPRWCKTHRRLAWALGALLALGLLLPTWAAADSLQELAQRLFPQATVKSIEPTPIPQLYEVRAGKTLVYMDATGRYVLVGELYDFLSRQNLTAAKLLALHTVAFADLPFSQAIHLGPAEATKRLAVFEDVDCPYCRRFHADVLPRLLQEGIGVEVFLLTLRNPQKHHVVWCSEDRAAALRAAMQDQLAVDGLPPTCETPLTDIKTLATRLEIHATPTFVFDTGLRVDGLVDYDALMARWQSSANRETSASP